MRRKKRGGKNDAGRKERKKEGNKRKERKVGKSNKGN